MSNKRKSPQLFFEVLDKKQLKILPRLEFLRRDYGFYLAGGTALALQIGHRTSLDFDYYSGEKFDNKKVFKAFQKRFQQLDLIQNPINTLIVRAEDIEVSVFYYEYPLLKQAIQTQYIDLASKEDIAAMKLIAIIQRGRMRDFIDMYFLMKEFSLDMIFGWTKKKFPPFNPYLGLRALTYFKDAEEDGEQNRFTLLQEVDWQDVKKEIIEKAYKFNAKELGW